MARYYVRIDCPAHPPRFERVDAEPVTVPGFESLDLFIHKNGEAPGVRISEGHSGLKVADGLTSEEAVYTATKVLKKSGLEAAKERIRVYSFINPSPRLKELP